MSDERIAEAMAVFERILAGSGGVECNRVDLATIEVDGLADADCAVVFGRGVQILGHWSELDPDIAGERSVDEDESFETEVEIAAAARWHPVVDGVGRFIARHRFAHSSHFRPDTTHLLVRKWAGKVLPVAWVRQSNGRAFYTFLGHPEDFRRREFVRLLLNAIEWARR